MLLSGAWRVANQQLSEKLSCVIAPKTSTVTEGGNDRIGLGEILGPYVSILGFSQKTNPEINCISCDCAGVMSQKNEGQIEYFMLSFRESTPRFGIATERSDGGMCILSMITP
jgi:hypothetical protein